MPLAQQLARLPTELTTHIVALAGVRVCAALRHLTALQRICTSYANGSRRCSQEECAAAQILAKERWSAGLELLLRVTSRYQLYWSADDCAGLLLAPNTIKQLWRSDLSCLRDLDAFAVLIQNHVDAGNNAEELVEWCCSHFRAFAFTLAEHLLRRGGSLDDLRALFRRHSHSDNDRYLAERLFDGAAKYGRLDLIHHFDAVHPQIAKRSKSAIQHAARGGHLKIVQFLPEQQGRCTYDLLIQTQVEAAVMGGHLEVVRWLYKWQPVDMTLPMAEELARRGYLGILRNAWRSGRAAQNEGMLSSIAKGAIAGNQLPVLQWLPAVDTNWCSLDLIPLSTLSDIALPIFQLIVEHAADPTNSELLCRVAEAGRRDLTEWVLAALPHSGTPSAVRHALIGGHYSMARWLANQLGSTGEFERIRTEARKWTVHGEWIDIVPYLADHSKCKCDDWTLARALQNGNTDAVRMLLDVHPTLRINAGAVTAACRLQDVALLRLVCEGMQITNSALDLTAASTRQDLVNWLIQISPPGGLLAMDEAASFGRLDVIKSLHNAGSNECTARGMDYAAENGYIDIIIWLHENRKEGCTPYAINKAAKAGLLHVVQWLAEHYPHTVTGSAFTEAARGGWQDVWDFLQAIPSVSCEGACYDSAVERGHYDLSEWIRHHSPALWSC
ncbi:hypothetical protein RI367_004475 [Sorochytrium milnesiophthora]